MLHDLELKLNLYHLSKIKKGLVSSVFNKYDRLLKVKDDFLSDVYLSQLLGCPEEVLEKALTSRTVETKGDKVLIVLIIVQENSN